MKLLSRIQDETAQGVVEFAFIVSALMLLFLGTVDYARFLYYDTAIRSAARVGAETASNHCLNAYNCGDPNTATTPTADSYVLWSTYCEANPYVSIQPSYTSCTPSASYTWSPTCSTSCTNCGSDVCVSPSDSSRSKGSTVTVTVGYNYHPLTFLLDWIFSDTSHAGPWRDGCWSSDGAQKHTLCASATGRVS